MANAVSDAADRSAIAGARAGRGFRFQDAVAAYLCVIGYVRGQPWFVAPEAREDITLEGDTGVVQVQAKSRRGQRGELTTEQVAGWIVQLWTRHHAAACSDPAIKFAVVVDRPIQDVTATGFDAHVKVPDDHPLAVELAGRLDKDTDPEVILGRTHVEVLPDPVGAASRLLARQKQLPDAVAELAVRQLQARLGEITDRRPERTSASPGGLAIGDVARIIDDTFATVDLDSLEAPVRDGLCEHADLFTELPDEAFYLGVDVKPGHVAAGLVLDRPDEVAETLDVLNRERVALITGPSGSGKTALAWLVADSTRHTVRWLRVGAAAARDVTGLVRYATTLLPAVHAPVGLIIDDVGSARRELWDALVREAGHRPGLLVLGTVREEDLDLLEMAPPSVLVRPALRAPLARAVWEQVRIREQTVAAGWREAFEQSDGLFLEYLHMLTTGDRLATTITGQVRKRRREHRDLELRVLRVVAFAALHGGQTDLQRLRDLLEVADEDLQRALARLLLEHLVRRTSLTTIGGLHRLRSEAIVGTAHHHGVPAVAETALAVLRTVSDRDLAAVTASLLANEVTTDDETGRILQQRLAEAPRSDTLIACLDGLREAGIVRLARSWLAVMDDERLPAGQREATAYFAISNAGLVENTAAPVRAALPRLTAIEQDDLRGRWLQTVPDELLRSAVASACTEVLQTTRLLEAFDEIGDGSVVELLRSLTAVVIGLSLGSLGDLIAAARGVAVELAEQFVDAAGGVDRLIQRARTELPWVASVDYRSSNEPEVEFTWLLIDEAQGDVHEAVVELCRLLAGLFPAATTISGRAVDASGQTVGLANLPLADKRIARHHFPEPVKIRWNRTLVRRFAQLAAPAVKTERLVTEASLVRRTRSLASTFAERWIRGQSPTAGQIVKRQALAEACLQIPAFRHVPDTPALASTTSETGEPQVGAAATVCHAICANALPRLMTNANFALAAFLHDTIHRDLHAIADPNYWSLLDEPPLNDVHALAELALHLHSVIFSRAAVDDAPSSRVRRAARKSGAHTIAAVAETARDEADKKLGKHIREIHDALDVAGLRSQVVRRLPSKPSAVCWPPDDVAVVIDVSSLFEWLQRLEDIVDIVSGRLDPVRHIALLPRRHGQLVTPFAMLGRRLSNNMIPPLQDPDSWLDDVAAPVWNLPALALFTDIMSIRATAPTLVALEAQRGLLSVEQIMADRAVARLEASLSKFGRLVQDDETGLLAWAYQLVDAHLDGDPAADLARVGLGENPALEGVVAVARIAIAEWDINPADAATMTEASLTSLLAPDN